MMFSLISVLLFTSRINGQNSNVPSTTQLNVGEQLELISADRNLYCSDMNEIITDLIEYNSNPEATEKFDPELIKHELQDIIDNFDDLRVKLTEIIDVIALPEEESSYGPPPPEVNAMHYHQEHDQYDAPAERRRMISAFSWAKLRIRYNNYCVDQRTDDGYTVWGNKCHSGANQKWTYNSGTEQIINGASNKCLDVNWNNGDDVYTHKCHGGNNQKWYFSGEKIKSRWNGECLDYEPKGKNIYTYPCHGNANQQFYT